MSIAFLEPVVRVREAGSAPHWVTLHAHGEEGEEGGGTVHVQIGGNGRVLAGPRSLVGSAIGHLASHPSVKNAEHHPPGHEPAGARSHPQYTEHQPPSTEKPAPLPGKPYARLSGAPQTRQEQPNKKEGPEPLTREQTHAGLQQAREQAKAARGTSPEDKAADAAVKSQQAQADLAAYRASKDRNPNPWAPHLSPPVNDAKDKELQEKATRAQVAHQSVQAQQQQAAAVQQQEGQRAHEREMVRLKADVAPKPAITPLQAPPHPTPPATGKPGEITKEHIQAKVAAGEHLTREEKGFVLNGYRMPKPKPEEPTKTEAPQPAAAEQPQAEATPALVTPQKAAAQPEPAGHDATLTRDRQTGRAWLDFGGQKPPQEHSDALKREGWRYSGYRQQWHNPRKYVQPPAGIRAHDAGHNDYSGERAERNEERAGKVRAEAHGQLQKAHDIGSMIPMGQPILVGHHSEGRHRRDIQRIDRAMGKGVEGLRHAEHLERRAESSRQTREDPGVVQRRIQRLEADKRSITQGVNRWPEGPARDARIKQIDDEIGAHKDRLQEMGGAGPALDYKPGDFVRSKGGSFRVEHVGPKNVKLTDLGPSGFVLTHDKSHVKEILKRGHEVSPEEHARITARIPFESERKRAYNPHKDERRRVRESASPAPRFTAPVATAAR